MAQANEKLGAGFIENLTAALGTESAFALNGFSVNGPTWVMAGLANDPAVIDSSLRKLMDTFNAELGPDEQAMLLRALEEKVFLPVGADAEVRSDFQLIAGTNRDRVGHADFGEKFVPHFWKDVIELFYVRRPRPDAITLRDFFEKVDNMMYGYGRATQVDGKGTVTYRLVDPDLCQDPVVFVPLDEADLAKRRLDEVIEQEAGERGRDRGGLHSAENSHRIIDHDSRVPGVSQVRASLRVHRGFR